MSDTWGHTCRPLSDDELANRAKLGWHCSNPKCFRPALFQTTYRYVTGRRGRVSHAERYLCGPHAERFCFKNKLELPPTGGYVVTASRALTHQEPAAPQEPA